jgi:DNA-binding response OmpR family regulator
MKEFAPFKLDTSNQLLWRQRYGAADERVLLTPKAFAALQHLLERSG